MDHVPPPLVPNIFGSSSPGSAGRREIRDLAQLAGAGRVIVWKSRKTEVEKDRTNMSKSATQTTLTADDMSDDEVPMLIEFDADSEGKPEPEQVKNDSKSDTEIETETETAAAPRTSTNASSPAAAAASSKFTAAAAGDDAIPLTIVTGWLGSGKTTLVRHILDQFQQMNKTIAIIQNEFSDLGVEDALKLQDDSGAFSEMMELSNGCVCCSVRWGSSFISVG